MRYAHLAPGHQREAINLLNGLTSKKTNNHKIVTIEKDEMSKAI